MWHAIPDGWWLTSETCKFMLACLVHKDNKDLSCHPTKLPPGRTRKELRKDKKRDVTEERANARLDRPTPTQGTYGDFDRAIKKAKMEGMNAYSKKTELDMIVTQINTMRENADILKSIHGEAEYNKRVADLIDQLPGVKRSGGGNESSTLQSSTPTGRKGMEVDLTAGVDPLLDDDDDSLE